MEDIAQTIRFGLYDSLLNAVNWPVLVVSSMGAQSTGKSYQLNHLGGTLFDVSGGRCTDGIWMSMRVVVHQVHIKTYSPEVSPSCYHCSTNLH